MVRQLCHKHGVIWVNGTCLSFSARSSEKHYFSDSLMLNLAIKFCGLIFMTFRIGANFSDLKTHVVTTPKPLVYLNSKL